MAKLDPYDELGVPRDADAAAIKKAFRDKSKKAHPDSGGSAEDFERLKRCQLVLLDPERRENFDRTGEIDEPELNSPEMKAHSIIAGVLKMIIDNPQDPTRSDLVAAMKTFLAQQIAKIEADMAAGRKAKERAEKMSKRFKRKSKGDNVISRMLDTKAREYEIGIRGLEREQEPFKLALLMVSEYTFDVEQVQYVTVTMGGAVGTTTTGGWG